MPFDDNDDEDAPIGGAPLPPDDRLWRHPSELGSSFAAPVAGSASAIEGPPSRVWAVAVVAGLIGSALSLGVVAVTGRFSNDVVKTPVVEKVAMRPIAELASSNASGQGVLTIAKSVAPAIVALQRGSGSTTVGSGILVRDDGYLVTNAHVVSDLKNPSVLLADGTSVPGQVIGIDALTDLAVIKIDRGNLAVAVLGTATDLQPGQPVLAVGAPLGPAGGSSVNVEQVRDIGRRVSGPDGSELRAMIQTDTPVIDGSSGGALCDTSGSVVGMLTTVSSGDANTSGAGFAIPVEIVRAVADDIIANGSARHPWLGVEGADLDVDNAKTLGVTGGAKVTKVIDDSPAAQAGVRSDDVITAINGSKITTMSAFVVALLGHHPGDSITIEILRGSDSQTMTVTLGEKHA